MTEQARPARTARVLVVGGGIGGLATALAVARRGHRVLVLERAERFAEIGAGIQIAPNGIHALRRLGLGDRVCATAVHMDELRFMDGRTGKHVVSMPLTADYRRRFGSPYVVVHRAELHSLLLDTCRRTGTIELRGSSAVVGYEQDATGAAVVLEGGGRIAGDAVVGADGIHSALRHRLVGDGSPRVSGISVYRTVLPMDRVPEEFRGNHVTWWAGPGCHFVHYPIAGGTSLNLAASWDGGLTEAFAGVPAPREQVLTRLAGLAGQAPQRLLRLGEDWKTWMLVDRDPVDDWTDGRVTLLGDAAHPMLHYAAQGACQALEDAVVLGDLLDCPASSFPRRLRTYNGLRRERTAAIQLIARRSVSLWHPAGAEADDRNAMLASLSATELHDHVAWMHTPTPLPGGPKAQ
ncbi:FAD-dependent oxidoreductase [Streptomyces sp. NPDC021356]|uniref:FAD-dependent oxidoreductase n=1 Tax=Streptomyces sp. NPDC021356 TaxID=3154900 RepID=UPI003409465D